MRWPSSMPCGIADFERLVLLDATGAAAGGAGIGDHLAGAAAGRAGLLDREESLRHAHVAGAGAGAAGLCTGARLGARTAAGLAAVPARHADLGREALGRLLERDLHAVAQVGAAIHRIASAARAAAEDVAEDVAERIGKAAEALGPAAAESARTLAEPGVTEAVVGRALAGVGQHFVGFLRFLELLFGYLGVAVRVAVRVMLHRELAIGLGDVLFGRVLRHAEDFVVIALRHGLPIPSCSSSLPRIHPLRPARGKAPQFTSRGHASGLGPLRFSVASSWRYSAFCSARQVRRSFHLHLHVQIAEFTRLHALDALATQAEAPSRLRARRDRHRHVAIECRAPRSRHRVPPCGWLIVARVTRSSPSRSKRGCGSM